MKSLILRILQMTPILRAVTMRVLEGNRIMTIATNRRDGWPQATMVGYANDGFELYFFVARLSQKFANIKNDSRVSVAIGEDFSDPLEIKGVSLAGRAQQVTDGKEFERAVAIFLKRFPEYADWPHPTPSLSPMMKVTPTILSVLDYSKGFGHSDLVTIGNDNLAPEGLQARSEWFARRG